MVVAIVFLLIACYPLVGCRTLHNSPKYVDDTDDDDVGKKGMLCSFDQTNPPLHKDRHKLEQNIFQYFVFIT